MNTKQFQEWVIKDLQRIVRKNSVSVERIAEISKAALELSRMHSEEISSAALAGFLSEFSECKLDSDHEMEAESSRDIATELKLRILKH